MKKNIITFSIWTVACCSMPLFAQQKAQLRWADNGDLLVSWHEKAPRLGGGEYCQYITPVIKGQGADSITLSTAIVRGRLNRKRALRAQRLQGEQHIMPGELQAGDTLHVERRLKAAPWMQQGIVTLQALSQSEGCCEVEPLPTRMLAQTVWIPPFIPALTPCEDNKGRAGELEKRFPMLRPMSEYASINLNQPVHNFPGALYIHFPLDKSVVRRDFRDNASRLDGLVHATTEILADSISQVRLIQIVGKASPDGPLRHNINLSHRRVHALKQYIQLRADVPDSLFEIVEGGEAWPELEAAIEERNDLPYREEMLHIINTEQDVNRREARLKALAGGKAYRVLKKEVLPDQRYSGYLRVFYDYPVDTVPPIVNRAQELIRDNRAPEAVRVVQTVAHDKRSWNTLAVALYLTGKHAEAEQQLQKAIAAGDKDARKNADTIKQITSQKALLKNIEK